MLHLHLIFNTINKYYWGYSADPWRRLEHHYTNTKDKFSSRESDWELKAIFEVADESTSVRLERFIKKQKSRILIEKLCWQDFNPDIFLA